MEKFDELLEKLNGLKITQKEMDWSENIPEEIWSEYFKNKHKELKTGLDVDTHRWYETSITAINIFDEPRILGVRHISNLFSESSDCEDICFALHFFEMKEVVVKSYELKEK